MRKYTRQLSLSCHSVHVVVVEEVVEGEERVVVTTVLLEEFPEVVASIAEGLAVVVDIYYWQQP